MHVSTLNSSQVYIHAKVICVDCTAASGVVFIGSENFSTSSLSYNRELGVVTTSLNAIHAVESAVESDYAMGGCRHERGSSEIMVSRSMRGGSHTMISSRWGITPRESIEDECRREGTKNVVQRCVAILSGDTPDEATLHALAGPGATTVLEGGEGGVTGYWPRVWAMRGLLYAWNDTATRRGPRRGE